MGLHANFVRERWDWVTDLRRYQTVRFIGVSRGRFFLGLIAGSPRKTQVQQMRERIAELEQELAAAKGGE